MPFRFVAYAIPFVFGLLFVAQVIGKLAGWSTVVDDTINLVDLTHAALVWFFSQPTWVFGTMFVVAMTVNATYLYRPQALMRRIDELSRPWANYAEAAQMIYEDLRDSDMVAGLVRDSNHPRPVEDVMSSWIEDGIKRGLLHPIGRLEHSHVSVNFPRNVSIETGVVFERSDGTFSDEIAAKDRDTGDYWRTLQFKIKDVRKYIKQLEADTIEFERRKALTKEGG